MLVKLIMKVLSNLFGLNKKISASDIAVKDNNGKAKTLNNYLEKNILTAYFSSFKSTGSLSPVTGLNVSSKIGSKLTVENNGIKIGSGISKVLVSGWGFNNTNSNGSGFIAGITKNGSLVSNPFSTSSWQMSKTANDNITMIISPMLIDVVEGDIVNIGLGINGNTSNYFSRGAVTVEVIE